MFSPRWFTFLVLVCTILQSQAQVLFNIDFGVGDQSRKSGFAAAGQSTNDFWNLYRHYAPRFVPGDKLVSNGELRNLKLADGAETKVSIAATNAPGVWGNSSGDSMYDGYIFAQNGSNIIVAIHGLSAGRYHFFVYAHADPDVTGEQNPLCYLRSGTNELGPLTTVGSNGWKATSPWQERHQYVVFRDVSVGSSDPVFLEIAPGPNGVAVLNGLQIVSRGTSPPRLVSASSPTPPGTLTNLMIHEVRYVGRVTDNEARFQVTLDLESLTTNEISRVLFEGDVAVVVPDLPAGLRIVSNAKQYRLLCSTPGRRTLTFELIAKISRAEPWNQINFTGPLAAIATVDASAESPGVEMQMLSGTQAEPKTSSRLRGFLGSDRQLTMRWQGKTTEVARKSLVTVDTLASAQVTPTVIKFNTQLRYEILQAPLPKLTIALSSSHALTKVQGEQIRDWSLKTENGRQLLSVEFVKPVEKSYTLTLLSEMPVDASTATLLPPQPLEVERESGSFSVAAEDMSVEIDSTTGLRQVNAGTGQLAAYRFYGRPFSLSAGLRRIEPVINLADRIAARLDETRLLVHHVLSLNVEKAGVYALEMTPQTNFVVTEVRGDGIDDWASLDGKLRISFSSKVLGPRNIEVHLEQALKAFPDQFTITPLRVAGATNETSQIGVSSGLGIQLKTGPELTGLREVPVTQIQQRGGFEEQLAFQADSADWNLMLAAERLPARVVADVFNLITVGDGLVGGSAVLRYGIVNQGVQEFQVKLPAHWKNVEFTGPNIRRKETNAPPAGTTDTNFVFWTIALQDKAWGGYTLVVTYDYQFDSKRAALDLAGAHALKVERETGSLAITTASSLQLQTRPIAEPLRLIDQTELAETDRALITRPVLLAYRYTGNTFALTADVSRNAEVQNLLNAVADRTQITSVITEEGQMLSQASFMVKNNDKQFQKFRLPAGASLWACYVNNQPVKGELDGDWLLVSLPRGANRDEAFAVDIVYKQNHSALAAGLFPKALALDAPRTDVPNTYAEWQVYVPISRRVSGFEGTMTVQRGTTYGFGDAWRRFTGYYGDLFRDRAGGIIVIGGGIILFVAMIFSVARHGRSGVLTVVAATVILAVMAGMLLPALSKAKSKAQSVAAISNLKQIALAARVFANENGEQLPASFDDMKEQLGSEKVLVDPATGERFVYVGGGKRTDSPQAILAYSPVDTGVRAVAFADGSVQRLSTAQFADALQRDAELAQSVTTVAVSREQALALDQRQLADSSPAATPANQPARRPQPQDALQQLDGMVRLTNAVGGYVAGNGQMFGAVMLGEPASAASGPVAKKPPTAAGLRSIRIELPRTGRMFTFTKVLNVSDEPLSVTMSVMKLKAFHILRSTLQLAGFLAGLFIIWREWARWPRRSFPLTIGAALVIGSVGALGLSLRALHLWLIALVPVAVVILFIWALKKFWPRRPLSPDPVPETKVELDGPETGPAPGAPPAVAIIAFLCTLALAFSSTVQAEEPVELVQASRTTRQRGEENQAVSILSAHYSGSVRERVAQLDATLALSSIATNQVVPLFEGDVAVQEFSTDAREVRLIRYGRGVALRLGEKGNATVKLKLAVRLEGDATKRRLAFGIPPALASRLNLTIDEGEADIEFPTSVSFQRTTNQTETRVEAVLGAGDRVELFWMPRMKRIAEMAASIFVQNTTLVTLGGGAVNTRSVLNYQVSQGELRQLKVKLPPSQRLLRVEGESIRLWELNDDPGGAILTVDLLKGVAPGYRLTVETEKILDKLPAQVRVETPHAMDVIRETGTLAVRGGEELSVAIENATDLQRIDTAEFTKNGAFKEDRLVSAFRFLKQGFTLVARADAIQPHVEAVARNSFRIGFEQLSLVAQVDYTIKKAGVFTLRLALPEGFKIESVQGSNIAQWTEKTAPRVLEVNLKERTLGAYRLLVNLSSTHKELPRSLALAGVAPVEVQKLTGFVSVSSEPGIGTKATSFDGLTEMPAAALGEGKSGSGSSVLAYKFVAMDPATAGAWRITVATEVIESWVRAEVVNIVSLSETLISGRSLVRYDIQNAPVKEFRLRVPTNFSNVEIHGANIRRRDRTNEEWRVELQSKVRGTHLLTVTWEQPRVLRTNGATAESLALEGVNALGVERETGSIVVMTKPPLQVEEKTAPEPLVKIDVRELPGWAGISPTSTHGHETPALTYRYLRPGYTLSVEAKRFVDAAVLQALIDSARFTTVVADDGQVMTEMVLSVRNNGLQHLEVELPPGSRVWSAFVAGEPVRPAARENKLLLPLERSSTEDAPVSVELIYVGSQRFPRNKGDVRLASPKLDVPLKNARWDLYLPQDYEYRDFDGSMTHEAEATPSVQVYSSTEYFRQEEAKKVSKRSEVMNFLSNAKSRLAEGKLKVANDEFNTAYRLNKDSADGQALRELEDLKKELGRSQSSNLIQAQRAYSADNARRLSGVAGEARSEQAVKQVAEQVEYDADAAEQQWGALQRAQEVTVAKVRPLRANLPTRGQRHSFSQVLQTEVGKEMTIQFSAANSKAPSWLKRIFGFGGAFLLLWILVNAIANRHPSRNTSPLPSP